MTSGSSTAAAAAAANEIGGAATTTAITEAEMLSGGGSVGVGVGVGVGRYSAQAHPDAATLHVALARARELRRAFSPPAWTSPSRSSAQAQLSLPSFSLRVPDSLTKTKTASPLDTTRTRTLHSCAASHFNQPALRPSP
ncbi:hypothetical protein CFE70_002132 [Pyrenophora teres f. teres 0-1]